VDIASKHALSGERVSPRYKASCAEHVYF